MDLTLNLLLSIIGFIIGFAAGALWKSRTEKDWVLSFVVVVVTSIWASSLLVDGYSTNYDPPTSIYPVMAAVIGLLGAQKLRGSNG